jgi:hypothetical protein
MSTIGAVPAPVSGTAGSSARRGLPSMSVVVPAGTSVLLPASAQGEVCMRCRSPPAKFTKLGSVPMLPVPESTPWTQLQLMLPPSTLFVRPIAPPAPLLK